MSIKGNQREQKNEITKYVGFTTVTVRAINPTRAELNKLLGKEDSDDDKEIDYLGEDKEGNKRLRMVFWLYDAVLDKYFPYSFNITDKIMKSKDGVKTQYINSVCMSSWSDTDENLANWFTNFLDKSKNEIGDKTFKPSRVGEGDLATIVRSWLGRLDWNDPDTSVVINTDMLFNEDYSELRNQISTEDDDKGYDAPFVALTGVRTDDTDPEKQYQQVYGKSFLPNGFLKYIEKNKFPTAYSQKAWTRFVDETEGEYGFDSYYELTPIKAYDKTQDPAGIVAPKDATPTNSKY